MAQTPRDDLSRRWLDKFNVDSGACRVFLGLRPDQQEALRRMGGLGQSHPSGVLMKRIRRSFGFVDLDTLMASDDFDQRSRSPALRIPNTKEGTSSLGGEQQGRREPQEGRHEQQGRREQQGRHEQQERREQQAGYLAEGEPGSKGGTSSKSGDSSKGPTAAKATAAPRRRRLRAATAKATRRATATATMRATATATATATISWRAKAMDNGNWRSTEASYRQRRNDKGRDVNDCGSPHGQVPVRVMLSRPAGSNRTIMVPRALMRSGPGLSGSRSPPAKPLRPMSASPLKHRVI